MSDASICCCWLLRGERTWFYDPVVKSVCLVENDSALFLQCICCVLRSTALTSLWGQRNCYQDGWWVGQSVSEMGMVGGIAKQQEEEEKKKKEEKIHPLEVGLFFPCFNWSKMLNTPEMGNKNNYHAVIRKKRKWHNPSGFTYSCESNSWVKSPVSLGTLVSPIF